MTWGYPDASRNAMLSALAALWNGGTIEIRTGAKPATPGAAATGTLLATVSLPSPAFGSPAAGVINLNDPPAVSGVASGAAGWCRVLSSSAAPVQDGTVTATGGGGDLTLSTTSITPGLSVDITGGTITQPAGG